MAKIQFTKRELKRLSTALGEAAATRDTHSIGIFTRAEVLQNKKGYRAMLRLMKKVDKASNGK